MSTIPTNFTQLPAPANTALWLLDQKYNLGLKWEDRRIEDEERQIHTAIIKQDKIASIIEAYEKEQPDEKKRVYDFSYAIFSDDVDFREYKFSGAAYFNVATFSGKAYFRDATFSGDANFSGATFSGDASFGEATFSGEADFREATFSSDANFGEATFSGESDFAGATFSGEAYFFRATFSGGASFEEATFSGDASFGEAMFSGNADFRSLIFKKDVFFTKAQFLREIKKEQKEDSAEQEKLYADFSHTKFLGQGFFYNIICEKLPITFKGAHITYSLHFLGAKIEQVQDKEDARIIKNEFQKIGNSLEAMKWETRELELYRKELKEEGAGLIEEIEVLSLLGHKKKVLSLFLNIMDRFTLCFQRITTNHGSSWWLGIFWMLLLTFLAVLVASSIYYKEVKFFPRGQTVQLLFTLFNPTHSFDEIFENIFAYSGKRNNIENIAMFFAIDFLTRVFNSVLIFQTIRAFRKFSRK